MVPLRAAVRIIRHNFTARIEQRDAAKRLRQAERATDSTRRAAEEYAMNLLDRVHESVRMSISSIKPGTPQISAAK